MKRYTNAKLVSSMEKAMKILDEPTKPCFCHGSLRCLCERNELMQQINDAHTVLHDTLKQNHSKNLDSLAEIQDESRLALLS